MGGTIGLLLNNFAGLNTHGDNISIDPKLPKEWKSITFNMTFRDVDYYFTVIIGEVS